MEQDHAREQAAAQYESIQEMLAAVEVDYDRLEALREEDELDEDDKAELVELEAAAGDCTDRDDAEQRIFEDPLEVQTRSGWHGVGATKEADEEFYILLCTGGPAVRIMGELNEHGEPEKAWLEHQDWGTPWTRYHPADSDVLVKYAGYFLVG